MKMKLFLLTPLVLLLFSCAREEQLKEGKNPTTENRTDGDCGFCSEINVAVNYSPAINNCCKAEVLIKSTTGTKNCKQMIFVNGEFLQFIEEDLTTLSYFICPSSPVVVRVMGLDEITGEFTKICYEERLSCEGCCDNVSFKAYGCGRNISTGCCDYTYTFFNKSSCAMNLYNAEGNLLLPLPINSTINYNFSACPNDPNSIKYLVGKSFSEPCKEFALSTDCPSACTCGTSTILVKQLKNQFIKGCCRFNITAYNKSNCELYLFTQDGSILATILPGKVFKTTVEECFSKTYYLGSNPNPNGCGVCTFATIKCGK